MTFNNYELKEPKLFNEFTACGKKIKPALSDDWYLDSEIYNEKIVIKSDKLNQRINEINVNEMFNILKNDSIMKYENNKIKITGDLIVGRNRKIYTKEFYDKWIEANKKIVDNKFNIKDLKPKKLYKFKDGSEMYYIGKDRIKGRLVRIFGKVFKSSYGRNEIGVIRVNGSKDLAYEIDKTLNELEYDLIITKYLSNCSYNRIESELLKKSEFIKIYDEDEGFLDRKYIKYITKLTPADIKKIENNEDLKDLNFYEGVFMSDNKENIYTYGIGKVITTKNSKLDNPELLLAKKIKIDKWSIRFYDKSKFDIIDNKMLSYVEFGNTYINSKREVLKGYGYYKDLYIFSPELEIEF